VFLPLSESWTTEQIWKQDVTVALRLNQRQSSCWGMSSVVKTYGASWVLMLILVPQISDSKKWIRCQLSVLGLPLFIKLLVYSFFITKADITSDINSASLPQSSVSRDPSEINLICWFGIKIRIISFYYQCSNVFFCVFFCLFFCGN